MEELIAETQPGFATGARDTNGVIQLRMNNVDTRGHLLWEEYIRVPADTESLTKYALQPGDVVFNNTNSTALVGKAAFFPGHSEPVVYSNHFTRLRVHGDRLDPRYLAFWLVLQWRNRVFEELCNRWIGQSAVPVGKLLALGIALPPLSEQRRIVALLDESMLAVDRARAAAEAQLAAARELPAAYLRHVLASKTAERWPTAKLDQLCKIVRGSSPRPKGDPRYYGGSVPRLMVADVTRDGMYVGPQIDFLTHEGAALSRPMQRGDVVMVVSGAPGTPAILAIDACIHDGFVGFRELDSSRILNVFLYYCLLSAKSATDSQAAGAIFRNLTTDQIGLLSIPVPPLGEQKKIVQLLDTELEGSKALACALDSQRQPIQQMPATLLRQAFNGEL